MAVLTNKSIASTYKSVLSIGATTESALTSSIQQLTDGLGNGSPLSMSTTQIQFNAGSNTFKFPTTRGTSGQILKLADANGTLDWVADASGDVTKTGTIALNTIAVWNDNVDELRSDTTMSINASHNISLLQTNSNDDDLNSYNIGGGNIANVTGSRNVGFGKQNLNAVLAGSDNTAMGNGSLEKVTSGNSNTGFGSDALGNSTDGDFNTAVGSGALNDVLTGENNTAVGYNAGVNVSTGSGNTYIGKSAGLVDVGSNNIYIGEGSGSSVASGNNNVILGSNTGNTISATSNNIIISDGSGNNRIQVDSGGDATFSENVIINTENSGIIVDLASRHGLMKYANYGAGLVGKDTGTDGNISTWLGRFNGTITSPTAVYQDLVISNSGNVGIGVSPSEKLHVQGNTRLQKTGIAGSVDLQFYQGNNASINNSVNYANIQSNVTSGNTGFESGQLVFQTRNSGTTATRLRITSGGSVGIGDTSTISELLYVSSISGDSRIGLNAPTNSDAEIKFSENNVVKYSIGHDAFTGNFVIGTANVDTPKLSLSSVGNVTIGTAAAQDFYLALRGGVGGFFGWDDSANKTIVQAPNTRSLSFQVNSDTFGSGTEALTITSGGNVGINYTGSFNQISGTETALAVSNGNVAALYLNNTHANGHNHILTSGVDGALGFYDKTAAATRMRISSSGFTKAKNVGSYFNGSYHEFSNNNNVSGDRCLVIGNTAGSNTNNTSSVFLTVADNVADRLVIYGNGDVQNVNNAYGQYSDLKLKENISDGTPKLNDLLKVKVKNFNFIGSDIKQIGVIAQELEEIFPSMISESPDTEDREVTDEEGNVTTEIVDLGTVTKSVKYSVFTPMLIKAIQEQQTIIEDLKARIETLEG